MIKIDRTNYIKQMKNGLMATIIKYNNNRSITVKFENEVILNCSYAQFKRGNIRCPMVYNIIDNNYVECTNYNVTPNCKFLIDLDDLDKVKGKFWCYDKDGYIINGDGTKLHRLVMDTPKGFETDHCSGEKWDNRKTKLRICNRHSNNMNQALRKDNTSGFKGITWDKKRKKWVAKIQFNKKNIHIGTFNTATEAAKQYNARAKELFGEFAWLNTIQEQMNDRP